MASFERFDTVESWIEIPLKHVHEPNEVCHLCLVERRNAVS